VKKFVAILMGMAVLWALPAAAFAQGFLGGNGTPGIGSFPFNWSNGACGAQNAAECGLPGTLRLYAGWLDHPNGSVWALQRPDSTGTAAWPLRGLWFGASTDLSVDGGLGLIISGSVFLPQRRAGTWIQTPADNPFDFDIPSYDWWSVDGLAKYPATGSFAVLAGFRWDHTSIRVDYSDNTSDDYILNAYIPLFGMQICQRASSGSLLLRAVGTPWVGGRLKYNFWDRLGYDEFGDFGVSSGDFLEIFADYSLKFRGDLSLGGFVKWNSLHVKTAERSLSGLNAEPVSWSVNIKSWTIGASLSLGFSTPLL